MRASYVQESGTVYHKECAGRIEGRSWGRITFFFLGKGCVGRGARAKAIQERITPGALVRKLQQMGIDGKSDVHSWNEERGMKGNGRDKKRAA